ncbi:MAG: glycosyltransferase [Melioribacteraceae bacterium]|nr:glycosyltransferase [Melioribacteraceae bacterium]
MVSINCITYNHEEYIVDAIESFLMQVTNFNFEILIGEDCSTDNTRVIVQDYARRYPEKIRIITSEKNVGGRKNSVRLQENSRGKYIAICEGDDYWTDPNKLQKQVDYMELNPNCTLCFHAAEIVIAPKKLTGRMINPYDKSRASPIEDFILGGGGFCATSSLLFPKELMKNPPEFYLNAPIGDYPMQMYLASRGFAYYMHENMAAYRSDVKGSWTNRLNSRVNVRENIIRINEGTINLLNGFNIYTNYKSSVEVEIVKNKLEFELFVLNKNKKDQKGLKFNHYSDCFKWKIRMKMILRCYFPNLFLKLVNLRIRKVNSYP